MMDIDTASIGNQGYRIINIPPEHIVSEFIAFPLASTAAFQTRLTRFDPGVQETCTQNLWRYGECQLVKLFPDFSIDQAVNIRDRLWFYRPSLDGEHVPLHEFLRRIAREFLEVHGQFAVPRPIANERERSSEENIIDVFKRFQTLRWLSFSLPTDLLLGALGNATIPPPARIHYLTDRLYNLLKDRGVAETHLHIGAALRFSSYWVAVLHALGSYELNERSFSSPGADFHQGRDLGAWLLRAAIARCLLSHYLATSRSASQKDDFMSYFQRQTLARTKRFLGTTQAEMLRMGIKELLSGKFLSYDSNYAYLRRIYREMAPVVKQPFPEHPERRYFHDPIATLVGYHTRKKATPEVLLVHRCLNHIEKLQLNDQRDVWFETLFWQTIRVRSILYRHIVQRPMIPGLQWFIRTYDRIKPGRSTLSQKYLARAAAKISGRNAGLQSLEVRTCPESALSRNLTFICNALDGIRKFKTAEVKPMVNPKYPPHCNLPEHTRSLGKGFEFGIVFHFTRNRSKEAVQGLPPAFSEKSEAEPCSKGMRYADYYRRKRAEAMGLGRLILNFPTSIKLVRGIDLCTDELGIPTWVLAPHIRYIHDVGRAASRYLRYQLDDTVPAPKVSVHSGEDFVHLLGGLRRVDEAIKYFRLRAGDRLGHGLALGVDPAHWAMRMGRIALSREERLLDLVWEWSQYSSQHGIPCESSRKAYLDREILRLSELIFGQACTPYQMENFVIKLHDENFLKFIGYPDGPMFTGHWHDESNTSFKVYHMLLKYLQDRQLFLKGQVIEWVDVTLEINSLKNLQKYLRQLISRLDLSIEINPSSNLLIGNLADLKNHPLWRLNPPTGHDDDLPPVTICIGSDDPLTFATHLTWEYELLHENLVTGGLTSDEAIRWIDQIRQSGIDNRFTFLGNRLNQLEKNDLHSERNHPTYCYALDLGQEINNMP